MDYHLLKRMVVAFAKQATQMNIVAMVSVGGVLFSAVLISKPLLASVPVTADELLGFQSNTTELQNDTEELGTSEVQETQDSIIDRVFKFKAVPSGENPEASEAQVLQQVPVPKNKPTIDRDLVVHLLDKDGAPAPMRKPLKAVAELNLDTPLSASDSLLYKQIFSLQNQGRMAKANDKIKNLGSGLLMGHVLAQRYLHPTAYVTRFQEIEEWLAAYSDHPQASRIHQLAFIKSKAQAANLSVPPENKNKEIRALYTDDSKSESYKSPKRRTKAQQKSVVSLFYTIRGKVRKERPTQALEILKKHKGTAFVDDIEYDQLLSMIASGYLYAGKIDKADKYARAAYKRSGSSAPISGWVLGLLDWHRKNYAESAQYFETSAQSRYASGWMVSAAAYWASRAHMRAGNVRSVSYWLERASTYPKTFYGLLAIRALGDRFEFQWNKKPYISDDDVREIEETQAGKRAKALIDIGLTHLAEEELLHAYKGSNYKKLLAYALRHNLPYLSIRLSTIVQDRRGKLYDSALYPIMAWEPEDGFLVDKALVHAFIRQESRFNVMAENPRSGATGLMQLMPATASYVSGRKKYKYKSGRHQLKNPETNIGIGQKYLHKLMRHKAINYDLLSLAIAYNAGPGNLQKWKRRANNFTEDPLLFIETIPYAETRAFVERVLSNYWAYRMQMNKDTPSLDSVAQGKWAQYAGYISGDKRRSNARFAFNE